MYTVFYVKEFAISRCGLYAVILLCDVYILHNLIIKLSTIAFQLVLYDVCIVCVCGGTRSDVLCSGFSVSNDTKILYPIS